MNHPVDLLPGHELENLCLVLEVQLEKLRVDPGYRRDPVQDFRS